MSQSQQSTKDVFDVVEGLTPVDPKTIEDFQRAMTNEVIPDIIKVIEERRLLAAKTRQQQLKL